MVDHIYGRGSSLVPSERPHIFAHELVMYVDYLERRIRADRGQTESREIRKISSNLMKGIEVCLEIAAGRANRDENLDSQIGRASCREGAGDGGAGGAAGVEA